MPLVSVITPVYNAAKWLPETLESVRNQTFPDWEHILIDDCSTDNSLQLMEQAAAADPRIRVLRMDENGGPAKACNRGLAAAKGRYIACLDSDDIWLAEKLERCIKWMQEKQHVFTYHDYRHISNDGKLIGGVVRGPEELNVSTLHGRRGAGCLTVVVDRELAPGFHFPLEDRTLPQDFPAWLWLIQSGHIGRRIPEDLARYRLTAGSRSSNKYNCARRVWRLYREVERLSLFKSLNWWTQYAWNSYWLHRQAKPRQPYLRHCDLATARAAVDVSPSAAVSTLPAVLVTIVTPVFNGERWLPEMLTSVQKQTLTNWEHIVVDDVSTDGTTEMVEAAAKADPRIRLLKLERNVGPASARNRALLEARGRYIAFLDADDLWLPRKLEEAVKALQASNLSFVYHDYRHISEDGNLVGAPVSGPDRLDVRTLHIQRGVGCLAMVIDRERVPGFHFPLNDRRMPEDFAAWLWLLNQRHSGGRLPLDLARYRITDGGRSANKRVAAFRVWRLYRIYEGLSLTKSLNWWSRYAWNAFWLHRRARPCLVAR